MVDIAFVAFIGTGREEGTKCYFQTKKVVTNNRPFEIWTNCRSLFGTGNFTLRDKPKMFLINLITGINKFMLCSVHYSDGNITKLNIIMSTVT